VRNSVLPLVLVVLCGAAAIALLPKGSPQGVNGPPIFPGIFRLPKQERFRVHPAELEAVNAVIGAPAAAANPPESWRSVMVAGEDDQATTRAVMYALAERLSEHGCLVVLDPPDAPPYGLGVERLVRVATRGSALPADPGGACTARVAVTTRLMRFPADHPASRLLPAVTGPEAVAIEIDHRSRAKAGSAVTWPTWYAALGWGIAGAAVSAFAPGGLPPVVEPAADPARRRSLASLRPLAVWKDALPLPPQSQALRWDGALQAELVRGWIGAVHGLETIGAKDARVPTIDLLLERLAKGGWSASAETTASAPGRRLFTRDGEHGAEWFSITPQAQRGWDVAWWQERAGIAALHQEWLDAAKAGDVHARQRLAAYLGCEAIPADQRAAAQALLGGAP
jgi:hypothetical protein